MMNRGTGLKPDKATWQSFEERDQLTAAQRPAHDNGAFNIHAVNLNGVLGDIQTNRGNLSNPQHHGDRRKRP